MAGFKEMLQDNDWFEQDIEECITAEVWKTFEDCAMRALAGERVMVEWELAKVVAIADKAMGHLEDSDMMPEEYKWKCCFDVGRAMLEDEIGVALAKWNKDIVPAINVMNMARRYQQPRYTLFECNKPVTRGDLKEALDNLKATENEDANISQRDLRTLCESLVKLNEDSIKTQSQMSDLDRKLDNAKAQMDSLKKTIQGYKKA